MITSTFLKNKIKKILKSQIDEFYRYLIKKNHLIKYFLEDYFSIILTNRAGSHSAIFGED